MLYKHARRRGTYIHCQAHRGGESARAAPLLTLPFFSCFCLKSAVLGATPNPLPASDRTADPLCPMFPNIS